MTPRPDCADRINPPTPKELGLWDRLRSGPGVSSAGAASGTQHDVVDVVRSRCSPGRAGSLLVNLDVP